MTRSWVQAPTDQSGKRLETDHFSTSGGTVIHRSVTQVGGITRDNIAIVSTKSPSSAATAIYIRWTPPAVRSYEYAWTASKSNATVITIGSGTAIAVTQAMVAIDVACTVGVGVRVGIGASTTPTGFGVVISHPGIVPGGVISRGDGSATLATGATGDDIRITADAATGGTARLLISYYEIGS